MPRLFDHSALDELDKLNEGMREITNTFYNGRKQWSQLRKPTDPVAVNRSTDIDSFFEILSLAEEESNQGVEFAKDVLYLLKKLSESAYIQHVQALLKDLYEKTGNRIIATQCLSGALGKLQDSLHDTHKNAEKLAQGRISFLDKIFSRQKVRQAKQAVNLIADLKLLRSYVDAIKKIADQQIDYWSQFRGTLRQPQMEANLTVKMIKEYELGWGGVGRKYANLGSGVRLFQQSMGLINR